MPATICRMQGHAFLPGETAQCTDATATDVDDWFSCVRRVAFGKQGMAAVAEVTWWTMDYNRGKAGSVPCTEGVYTCQWGPAARWSIERTQDIQPRTHERYQATVKVTSGEWPSYELYYQVDFKTQIH